MTGVKSLGLGLLILATWATTARSDVISGSGTTQWVSWTTWSFAPQASVSYSTVTTPTLVALPTSSPSPSSSASVSAPAESTPAVKPSAVVTPMPPASSGYQADAFLNFGSGPYPDASGLTTGNASAFQNSPVLRAFLGDSPTSQQLASFEQTVLQRVQQTYQQSGVPIRLTTDPGVSAAHTMSVVSGTSFPGNGQAVGITNVGQNGFAFLDKFTGATSLDQLEWALAHNISHELMHAFGIGTHPDQTGKYIDSGVAPWSLMTDANAGFSPAAAQLLHSTDLDSVGAKVSATGAQLIDGDQVITPEPAALALWCAGLLGAWSVGSRRKTAGETSQAA